MTVLTVQYSVTQVDVRDHLTAGAFVLALSLGVVSPGLHPVVLPVQWACLIAGLVLAPKSWGPGPVRWGLAVIVLSTLAAVPTSLIGLGSWPASLTIAGLTLPYLALYVADHGHKLWRYLELLFLTHLGAMIIQVFIIRWPHRADGLAWYNPNVGAGLLVLAATYYLTQPGRRWWALPFISMLPFTGSRWAAFTMVVVLAIMFVQQHLKPRYLLVAATVLIAVLMFAPGASRGYRLDQPLFSAHNGLTARLALPAWPSAVPQGFIDPGNPHNVPLRMSIETGIASALAWLALMGWGLLKGSRYTTAWWLLLVLGLLAMMDTYVWLGPLAGFWWLVLGQRLKHEVPV